MNFRAYPREPSPKVLDANDLQSLAKYMKSGNCRNIFLMLGAGKIYPVEREQLAQDWEGVSTSAGIPDFRSPETGLYANLARLDLPYPEAVFHIDFFRRNPVPFYTLVKELYSSRYRPTLTHSFVKVLHAHDLLHTCFTQNIDTLERRAGVPEGKIIEAHGSFATQRCIDCTLPCDDEKIKNAVINCAIPRCEYCNGLVKPDIVFFGEALPPQYHVSICSLRDADLLIVIGTSLSVHPFASLVGLVPDECPRVLINLDEVGDFDRQDDVVLLGKCDDIVRELCGELGWEAELDGAWAATADGAEVEDRRENVGEELERITRDLEKSLAISGGSPGNSDGGERREEDKDGDTRPTKREEEVEGPRCGSEGKEL